MLHQKIAHIPHVYIPLVSGDLSTALPSPYNAGTVEEIVTYSFTGE